MSEYFDCGYARVAVREGLFNENNIVESNPDKRLSKFLANFDGPAKGNFGRNVKKSQFMKMSKKLLKILKAWKGDERQTYFTHFSSSNWRALPEKQKKQHSRTNCKGCLINYHKLQCSFPVKKARHLTEAPINLLETSKTIANNVSKSYPKPGKEAIKSTVKEIYTTINGPFSKVFGIDFNEGQTKVPSLNLQIKPSQTEQKKISRDRKRKEKKTY